MPIDERFVFSANNLQDYLDCPRRFELKYLLRQSWPAEESEPVLEFERRVQLGSQFHQLVARYLHGVPREALLASIPDPDLESWFRHFLAYYDNLKFERIFPEFTLRQSLGGRPLVAVFDLLGLTAAGELCILDWKTSGKIPRKEALAERVQTILYPFIALEAAPSFLPGITLQAGQERMTYVYVHQASDNQHAFDYSTKTHAYNQRFLESLLVEITAKSPGTFECTSEKRRCKFCVYRSLCERGVAAGNLAEMDSAEDLQSMLANLDFDVQDEIAF